MKTIEVLNLVNRKIMLAIFTLLAFGLLGASLNSVRAQSSTNTAVDRAQEAVRQRIISQEGRRDNQDSRSTLSVRFNDDPQTIAKSRIEVRVRGTGTFLRNNNLRNSDQRYPDARNNTSYRNDDRRSREFSYEATVNSRSRYGSVSAIRYDWKGAWSGNDSNVGDNDRHNGNRDGYNDGRRDNRDGDRGSNRPNGRVTYSGPIMNRNSEKSMDVTERGMRDGDNIQQWSYADQPNQNWDIIDLGSGEVAIISRHSGKAITAEGGRHNNGTNIIQRGWNASPQQRWRMEKVSGDYYRIVSVDNGKCLDVTEHSKQDGAHIQLWDYATQSNQQWRLRR
jgi:hypothetical protein